MVIITITHLKRSILAAITILLFNGIPSVLGQNTSSTITAPTISSPTNSQNQTNNNQTSLQTYYCPAPSQLTKNGLYWGTATGGWKSYSESFDTAITSLVGAQWVGVNVGKMICIYKGNLAVSFPITIQNDILALAPAGGAWGKDLGGYRNCHSSNSLDCPFTVQKSSVNIKQIYESIDFFKNKPDPLAQ